MGAADLLAARAARMAPAPRLGGAALLLLLLGLGAGTERPAPLTPVSRAEARALRDETRALFLHAYRAYAHEAWPADTLAPLSCGSGGEQWGGLSLTLVDALDTLAVVGAADDFEAAVLWACGSLSFDVDANVSVFETTIRALGGLLSAHALASDGSLGLMREGTYPPAGGGRDLLALAHDLGARLLPAFDTPTAIPVGTVNLRHGVAPGESPIACTAAAGSLTLEFGALARLTADRRFDDAATAAARALWARRSRLGLVGAHIDVRSGRWTHQDAGVGRGIDSFVEYLLKAALLFGDEWSLRAFRDAHAAFSAHTKAGHSYLEVHMSTGSVVWLLTNSLMAFWPGMEALAGELDAAVGTARAQRSVAGAHGWLPEGFSLTEMAVEEGQAAYPLRPELIESLLYLHHASGGHPEHRLAGRDALHALLSLRTRCGVAAVADVRTGALQDSMESFFLAETAKYLYLLFDDEEEAEEGVVGAGARGVGAGAGAEGGEAQQGGGSGAAEAEAEASKAGGGGGAGGAAAPRGGGLGGRAYWHGRYVFTTEGHLLPYDLPPLPPRDAADVPAEPDAPPPVETSAAAGGGGGEARAARAAPRARARGVCATPSWAQTLGLYAGGPLEGGADAELAAAVMVGAARAEAAGGAAADDDDDEEEEEAAAADRESVARAAAGADAAAGAAARAAEAGATDAPRGGAEAASVAALGGDADGADGAARGGAHAEPHTAELSALLEALRAALGAEGGAGWQREAPAAGGGGGGADGGADGGGEGGAVCAAAADAEEPAWARRGAGQCDAHGGGAAPPPVAAAAACAADGAPAAAGAAAASAGADAPGEAVAEEEDAEAAERAAASVEAERICFGRCGKPAATAATPPASPPPAAAPARTAPAVGGADGGGAAPAAAERAAPGGEGEGWVVHGLEGGHAAMPALSGVLDAFAHALGEMGADAAESGAESGAQSGAESGAESPGVARAEPGGGAPGTDSARAAAEAV